MGAEPFLTFSAGATVEEAFNAAVSEARWQYGHRGYTGTIGEKTDYVVVAAPDGWDAQSFAELVMAYNSRDMVGALVGDALAARLVELYENKWGPAVAVNAGSGRWLFFGLASC